MDEPSRLGAALEGDVALDGAEPSSCQYPVQRDADGACNNHVNREADVVEAVVRLPGELEPAGAIASASSRPAGRAVPQAIDSRFGDLIGHSPQMRELFADLQRIASSSVGLLIEGETGTGKELVADSVHRKSPCAQGPYVVYECGAATPALAESDLFGYEGGAFSGAHGARGGIFEQAHGGTIVLDEIGELPREVQPKLLRVLENGEVRRLGASRATAVSFRLIATTNRNLEHEVRQGKFRQDLFFRLAEARVEVPALRDRITDLPLLIDHFLGAFSPGRTHRDMPPELLAELQAHRWPGNVRELRNFVRRFVLTPERPFKPVRLDRTLDSSALIPLRQARREAVARFERDYLAQLLHRSGGNVTRAAAMAQVSRQLVQKLLRRNSLG